MDKGQRLNDIKRPVEEELTQFEKYFRSSMESKVPLLDRITYFIVQRKGKQIRPLFVFLCSKLLGPQVPQKSFIAASLIELMHTASLVHDDVVDDSLERRGFFSVNALWKNKAAVLVGDFLLAKGLLLSVENECFDILKIVSKAVKEMSEGELLQMEKARRLDIEEEIYYNIIRQKTASLIASACASGLAAVTDDAAIVEKGWLFGQKVGMAFQIKDDLFDYGEDNVGKPTGIDIKEKKMTLPLIYALSKCSYFEKRDILRRIKKKSESKETVKYVIDFVRASGGLEYTEKVMNQYRDEALELLETFPEGEARQSLHDLVLFVTNRKK